jgi:serine/threonine-protein kinase RsbW
MWRNVGNYALHLKPERFAISLPFPDQDRQLGSVLPAGAFSVPEVGELYGFGVASAGSRTVGGHGDVNEHAVTSDPLTGATVTGQPPAGAERQGDAVEDAVEIRLPADSAYLSVLRTATAGLAARLNFTLDEIEDLRIAVDEACAMLLPQAIETAQLSCRFRLGGDTLEVMVTVPTTRGDLPEKETFAWTVLSALAGEVDCGSDEEQRVWIRLRKRRGSAG